MFTYINEDYMVVEQCLLAYTGKHINVIVPERLKDGQAITEIGSQSFALKNNLKSIIFPDSIKVMGSGVLNGCKSVNYIELPLDIKQAETLFDEGLPCESVSIRLDEQRLSAVKANIFKYKLSSEAYLLDSSALGAIKSVMTCWPKIMSSVQKKQLDLMSEGATDYKLFDTYQYIFEDKAPDTSFVENNIDKIHPLFSKTSLFPSSEFDAIMSLISTATETYEDDESEARCVWSRKTKADQGIPYKIFLLGKDGKSAVSDDPVIVIRPCFGYMFFPSIKHIVVNGDYWVYRRCYFGKEGYVPRDIAIFDRNGIVLTPDIKRKVYEKYRFITSLYN